MSEPSRPRPDEVGGQPAEFIDTPHDQPGDQRPPRDVSEGPEDADADTGPEDSDTAEPLGDIHDERLGAEGSDLP